MCVPIYNISTKWRLQTALSAKGIIKIMMMVIIIVINITIITMQFSFAKLQFAG